MQFRVSRLKLSGQRKVMNPSEVIRCVWRSTWGPMFWNHISFHR